MTTVYTHIKPFEKRAISFFRQCIGSFSDNTGTIGELTRRQEFFGEFLTSFGPSLTGEQREYLEACAKDVEEALGEARIEKDMVESILKLLNPCRACKGSGEFYTHVSHDDGYYSDCPGCDGTGIYKG